ncbi:MAG TPA: FHA domain-containing protein [Ignavibacteriales bacterium]|nr:FHA domain-containing protein [Ignavibacteriales bacterium]
MIIHLFILIGVVVLAIAVGIFYYLKNKKNISKKTGAESIGETSWTDLSNFDKISATSNDAKTMIDYKTQVFSNDNNEKTIILEDEFKDKITMYINSSPIGITQFEIRKPTVIGRKSGDIIIQDPQISREHTKIYFDGKNYIIEDLGSTNGLFKDGEKVKNTTIKSDTSFIIGQTQGYFKIEISDRTSISDNSDELSKTKLLSEDDEKMCNNSESL